MNYMLIKVKQNSLSCAKSFTRYFNLLDCGKFPMKVFFFLKIMEFDINCQSVTPIYRQCIECLEAQLKQEHSESADLRQGDPDNDPDHTQNIINFFLVKFRHVLKTSSESVDNFLNYLPLKNSGIQKIQTVIRITPKI